MQESITMAEVGSMVKVSGSRMATPFGPPRPGSTPTKIPSTRPTIISASVLNVSRTEKPWMRRPIASMAASITQQGFKRPLRHDDVESDLEGDEHGDGENHRRQNRLPPRDPADQSHETDNEDEARDIESEPLHDHHVE